MKMMTGMRLFLKDSLQFILAVDIIYFANSEIKAIV